jgi:hypothetical protein
MQPAGRLRGNPGTQVQPSRDAPVRYSLQQGHNSGTKTVNVAE